MRWLRHHATVAPFGIFTATLLMTLWLAHWQWLGRTTWELMAGEVDLGAVLYTMVAVLAERGLRLMFWALDQRRKWRAKMRAEARAEGYAEAKREFDAQLERVAQEARDKGIELEEVLPKRDVS
ncbi:MAG: hypothetical protein F4W95_05950 [Chloroflexi bacterium]|nr:hypothetical protein [Chloroflexota bacterium]MYD48011.1 hypothetical protein [Chloroflexota bacterium]